MLFRSREGFTLDQARLQDAIAGDNQRTPEEAQKALANFEQARTSVGRARSLLWVAWVVLAVVLAGIGFLGGRSWGGRLAWAGAVLTFAALIVFVASGPAYSNARPQIVDAFARMGASGAVEATLKAKGQELLLSVADSVVGGVRTQSLLLLVLGVAGIGGGIYLNITGGRKPATARPTATT